LEGDFTVDSCFVYAEAEYMAVTEIVKETIWLRGLVENLGLY